MRALVGELLLEAWERGAAEPELRRPLALLAAALPDRDPALLGALPVSERNLLLLELHEMSFGPALDAVGRCRYCAAPFEFTVPAARLAALARDGAADRELSWTEGERRYRLRQLTTDDLIASLEPREAGAAQQLLLSRCLTISPDGDPSEAALERFDRLHAGTELACAIACPQCGSAEQVDLDIGRFLWTEVRRAAKRLLREVHALAAAYGWSEPAVLALGEPRRAAYLELVGAG
jgi:hypothetical protein